MSLYTDLVEAGVEIDHWQSDLYFALTDVSTAILNKYPNQSGHRFQENTTHQIWYCANFAYDPYWPHGNV